MNVVIQTDFIPCLGLVAAVTIPNSSRVLFVTPAHDTEHEAIEEARAWALANGHTLSEAHA